MNIVAPGKTAVTVNGGDIFMSQIYFQRSPVTAERTGGRAVLFAPTTNRLPDKPEFTGKCPFDTVHDIEILHGMVKQK